MPKTIKNFSRVFNWHWIEQHHLEELWAFFIPLFFSSYRVEFEAGGNGNTGPDEKLHDIVRWKYRCWLADAFHAWSTTKSPGRVICDEMRRDRECSSCLKGPTPTGGTTAANEGALANFFNSLLTRKSGGPGTPTASTPATGQRQSKMFAPPPPPSRSTAAKWTAERRINSGRIKNVWWMNSIRCASGHSKPIELISQPRTFASRWLFRQIKTRHPLYRSRSFSEIAMGVLGVLVCFCFFRFLYPFGRLLFTSLFFCSTRVWPFFRHGSNGCGLNFDEQSK